jgi:flagellar hook assembly protein FlgD
MKYGTFLQLPSMPAFNDDKGTVVLLHGDDILDEFSYSAGMHFGLISNPEGVSLERIDPDKPTQTNTNWHSAAASSGWATPANQNSQFRKLSGFEENSVVVEPETISPDNDGYNDVAFIRYKFDEPGYVANVSIYDARGRELKKLAMNHLLAVEGEFAWDGLRQDGKRADIGIYVIYFEVFNLKGVVKKYKKVCVVAERLN